MIQTRNLFPPGMMAGPGLLLSPQGTINLAPRPFVKSPGDEAQPFMVGPTGGRGPTGPASTVPGPTGPASTVPGPTGPASTVPGPTGPASTVPGPTGGIGPTGPKGSFVKNALGIYEFACIEGAQPWFMDIRPMFADPDPKFIAATVEPRVSVRSEDGAYRITFAPRNEFPEWRMPEGTEEQRNHSVEMWNKEYLKA